MDLRPTEGAKPPDVDGHEAGDTGMLLFGVEDFPEKTRGRKGCVTVSQRKTCLPANLAKSNIATDTHVGFAARGRLAWRAFQKVGRQTARLRWNGGALACGCGR